MTVSCHTSGLGGPGGAALLTETDPLSFPPREGEDFSYASVPCETSVPFNDVALEFNPDYPGIEDPASARFIVEGEVTELNRSGKKGDIEGTITMFLCENGEEGDQIVFAYDAKLLVKSDNLAAMRGTWEIVEGTGRFDDMEGQGSIHGRLTCLERVLDHGRGVLPRAQGRPTAGGHHRRAEGPLRGSHTWSIVGWASADGPA